jgi:hypothetical protein
MFCPYADVLVLCTHSSTKNASKKDAFALIKQFYATYAHKPFLHRYADRYVPDVHFSDDRKYATGTGCIYFENGFKRITNSVYFDLKIEDFSDGYSELIIGAKETREHTVYPIQHNQHGRYMITTDKLAYAHKNKQLDFRRTRFDMRDGDTIRITYNAIKRHLIFDIIGDKKRNDRFIIPKVPHDAIPCVILGYCSVKIMSD